jgi:hypothetical protein
MDKFLLIVISVQHILQAEDFMFKKLIKLKKHKSKIKHKYKFPKLINSKKLKNV